jgi:hypothetical protein
LTPITGANADPVIDCREVTIRLQHARTSLAAAAGRDRAAGCDADSRLQAIRKYR